MNTTPKENEVKYIREALNQFNKEIVGDDGHTPLNIIECDENGNIIGGILGGTYWGWMYVDILWVAEREPNRIARRRCIFASFGVLSLARFQYSFAKSHQNLSKMHSPAGASSFDTADFFESKSFSRRAYRRYVQEESCRNRTNLHVKTNLVRLPFG